MFDAGIAPDAAGASSYESKYLTFNTPVGTPTAAQCGRATFSDVHLSGETKDEAEAQRWLQSPEGKAFVSASSQAWGAAFRAAGATAAEAASAVQHTTAFYTADGTPE